MTVIYKCFNCGKEIPYDKLKKKVRCPYCGSRILYKPRPKVVKIVKAR